MGCTGGGSWPSNLRADSHLCTEWVLGPLCCGPQHSWEGERGREGGGKGLEGRAMGRGRKKEDGGGWREKKVGCMNESQYLYTLHSINKGIILHGARAGSVLDQAGLKGRAA